jgi:hypothetical protein
MLSLPQGEGTAPGSYFNEDLIRHYQDDPQEEQLVAEQPAQEETPAELETVSPPPPLLTNPQADSSLFTSLDAHLGHSGLSPPIKSCSKLASHLLQ